jgi:hypothetical protein
MTDNQKQKISDKIVKIRKALAAERKKFGGYDDSRGMRYIPTSLYVKIGDYKRGSQYLKWFDKNFPGDVGVPGFLFESTLIYFKIGNLKEAEVYAFRTYASHTKLINTFYENEGGAERVNITSRSQQATLEHFYYRHHQPDLKDFSAWFKLLMQSDEFIQKTREHDDLVRQLETEPVGPKRSTLVAKLYDLL